MQVSERGRERLAAGASDVGFLRKYREVLALLALLSAAVLSFLARRDRADPRSRLDRAVVFLTAPIERAVVGAAGGAIDLVQSYLALHHVRERNVVLQRRIAALEVENARLSAAAEENARLRDLLSLARAQPLDLLGARVIGDSLAPGAMAHVIRVGAGEDRGVRRDMAVVAPSGIVGRVLAVFPSAADVELLVDPDSAVAARVVRSRARATVSGTGAEGRCRLDYALRSDDIEEGDALATSGTDGIFPPGLPIGKVASLARSSSGMFLRASVVPAVDVRRLEEVMIVLGTRAGPDAPAASR